MIFHPCLKIYQVYHFLYHFHVIFGVLYQLAVTRRYAELQMPTQINTAGKIVDEMANLIIPQNNEK